jgi:hypothetical protein
MDEIRYLNSQRNNTMLLYRAYVFNLHSKNENSVRWRCSTRKCKAYIIIKHDIEVFCSNDHTHPNDELKIVKLSLLGKLREKAKKTQNSAVEIITRETCSLNDESLSEIPKYSYLIDVIKKERNKRDTFIPHMKQKIPLVLQKTLQDKPFYRICDIASKEKVLVFYSDISMSFAAKTTTFLIDGTFKSVPSDFCQLITVHALIFGKVVPIFFALLTSKTEENYFDCFKVIKEAGVKIENVIIDLEYGLKNAISRIFPGLNIYYCNFHFGQCIWRRVQFNKLGCSYRNNASFSKVIRMYLNLAFFPLLDIEKAYAIIKKKTRELNLTELLVDFDLYFKVNFIGSETPIIKEPKFCKLMWNCFSRIESDLPRTTNSVEAWHRGLNASNARRHPNLGSFITILQNEEEKVRIKLSQWSKGRIEINNQNLVHDEKLRVLIRNYSIFSLEDYFIGLEIINSWKFKD